MPYKEKQNTVVSQLTIDYYQACLNVFIGQAKEYKLCSRGLVDIPELYYYGIKASVSLLQDERLYNTMRGDTALYLYTLLSCSIKAGLLFGAQWQNDRFLMDEYTDDILAQGLDEAAADLLEKHFPDNLASDGGQDFFMKISICWAHLFEPYRSNNDSDVFISFGLLAAFQLGVSMIISQMQTEMEY